MFTPRDQNKCTKEITRPVTGFKHAARLQYEYVRTAWHTNIGLFSVYCPDYSVRWPNNMSTVSIQSAAGD